MSTKIWEAYKCPIDKLNEVTDIFRKTMFDYYITFIRTIATDYKPEFVKEKINSPECEHSLAKVYSEMCGNDDIRTRLSIYLQEAKEAAKTSERTFIYDINCGFNL